MLLWATRIRNATEVQYDMILSPSKKKKNVHERRRGVEITDAQLQNDKFAYKYKRTIIIL